MFVIRRITNWRDLKIIFNMKVLILCTGNSCRSQMAHGFLQSFDDNLRVCSAGTKASGKLNTKAVEVMQEAGIDISHHTSDSVDQYLNEEWDYVITVCGGAKETCPMFSGKVKHQLHIGFDDPSDTKGTSEVIQSEFIRVRDEIKKAFYYFYQENILLKEIDNCSDKAIICHCGNITLGEIKTAIMKGNTSIQSIRIYLNKQKSGECKTMSPSGSCCHSRFNKIIQLLTS